MTNKKAQIFEQGLVIVVFALCVMALGAFILYNGRIITSLDNLHPVVFMHDEQRALAFYAKDAGKLASEQAFSSTINDLGKNCQRTSENINYELWKKDCLLKNDEAKKRFLGYANSSMSKMLNTSFSLNLDSTLAVTIKPVVMNVSLKNMNIDYTSDISYSINLDDYGIDLNFEKMYNSILDRWDDCKIINETQKIKDCMYGLKIKGWILNIKNDNFFCDLISEKSYYNGNFEPLIIKFKLEK
jgi:hypothetical protein